MNFAKYVDHIKNYTYENTNMKIQRALYWEHCSHWRLRALIKHWMLIYRSNNIEVIDLVLLVLTH